ncbi:class I SAM-dependent methyltransferase, partial [Pelagibacteraceae bacterium]|nr:class I SAM-dependent methyltransferase [Pelagibacteraceae bacterium]
MNFKFKKYWRKTGLNEDWGNTLIEILLEKKPKHFLEIGVFCGVTSRNVCELLNTIHHGDFSYRGFDLFGEKSNEAFNEVEPEYIKSQKFSNPLKHFYYNILLKENLNSKESVENFLIKFKKNVTLIKG